MKETPPAAGVWTERFKVHSYEVDLKRQATLLSLCRYFQEAAWNHAEALGVGFSQLQREGRLWVLSRLAMIIERYPRWNDTLVLNTWPRAARSVFAMRDFEMLDGGGQRLAAGSSAWLVLEAATRKPLRVDKALPQIAVLDQRAIPEDPTKLPPLLTPGIPQSITVAYGDIDMNQHVTYARYIGWLLDVYPLAYHASLHATSIEVNFLGEALGGETLSRYTEEVDSSDHRHSITRADGEEVCRARIRWSPSTVGPMS